MADEGGHSIGMSEHCSIFFLVLCIAVFTEKLFEYSLEIMVNLQG